MPGISFGETTRVERFTSIDDLPVDASGLLTHTLFASMTWWQCVEQHALAPGISAVYLVCRIVGKPAGLLALSRASEGQLASLTTPYSCVFPILLAPSLPPADQDRALRALLRVCRMGAVTRLEALDPGARATSRVRVAAMRTGLLTLRFDHFGNWHEDVSGQDWPAYLAERPGALRETIRRRLRSAERQGDVTLRVVDGPEGLERGIADYEAVFGRSWKAAEPFPGFNPSLIRALAAGGTLRLGILDVAGQPIAVQFWVVTDGTATVLKLAHDEAHRRLSPGTVLTAMMVRRLLEQDKVTELDFGRGDDDYKQGWVKHRRQMMGLLILNPIRPASWPLLGRHAVGRLVAAAKRWKATAKATLSARAAQRTPKDRSVTGPASSQ